MDNGTTRWIQIQRPMKICLACQLEIEITQEEYNAVMGIEEPGPKRPKKDPPGGDGGSGGPRNDDEDDENKKWPPRTSTSNEAKGSQRPTLEQPHTSERSS